jgi:2-polyprenyl-3-methyl-5-hydroxy-6-metoxy-1,4-benzoquinol methylase
VGFFIPDRRRGQEILDDPGVDAATRLRSLGDVTRSNRYFGGMRAALVELRRASPFTTLLDVGTGLADIPGALRPTGVISIGLDEAEDLLREARTRLTHPVRGSATALPFRDKSVDVVLCSQLLHHFPDERIGAVIVELDRVARRRVIIADIRRSWLAASGFWVAASTLGFHRVTRHDGVLSVLRGFTVKELRASIGLTVGIEADVVTRAGFRITASWTPRSGS